jgi:hypothetical protein
MYGKVLGHPTASKLCRLSIAVHQIVRPLLAKLVLGQSLTQPYPAARLNGRVDQSPSGALIDITLGLRLGRQSPVWLDLCPLTHLRVTVIPQQRPAGQGNVLWLRVHLDLVEGGAESALCVMMRIWPPQIGHTCGKPCRCGRSIRPTGSAPASACAAQAWAGAALPSGAATAETPWYVVTASAGVLAACAVTAAHCGEFGTRTPK